MGESDNKDEVPEGSGICGIEDENSPDSLKNTPSNIARLEDVIEQCEGRKKYLAQTKSLSDGEDIRWYFYKVPLGENELAASVPRSEVVGKTDSLRFSMRDSLALEASFLQREEELLSKWWREYGECSVGPIGSNTISEIKPGPESQSSIDDRSRQLLADDEERVGVPVKGGLFEVDLAKRHCFPVYWSGENRRVLRGHWFARKSGLDWLPLREDVAEQLEFAYRKQVWHRRTFQQSGLFAARIDLQGFTPGLHALFTGEDDTWEAWLNADSYGFSNIVGLKGNAIKLRRGYSSSGSAKPTQDELRQRKEEEMDDYSSQVPVRHLVFMVHGIGQRLEKANLVDDVGDFRAITANLAEHHLSAHQLDTQRVLFIPCQWRKGLKLDGENAVEKVTLQGVRGLRFMLSATVHDVLYYMSPIYCQEIINSVSNQLNRLYLKFIKRNPGYDGKVSIYAHSLGSVLSYDILCHQENLSSQFPVDFMYKERGGNKESCLGETDSSPHCRSSRTPRELSHTLSQHTAESEQPSGKSSVEDEDRVLDQGSSDALPLEDNSLGNSTSTDIGVLDGVLENLAENTSASADTTEEGKTINMLTEEVLTLKARIAELESHHGGEGNKEVNNEGSYQSPSQKLPSEQGNMTQNYTPQIKYTKLEFKVDTFFAVGSPLGFFLSLRNVRIGIGRGLEYWQDGKIIEEMPACRQMLNIFHPFDPVAYRVEPLVCKEYFNKRPVLIPYHKGGKRLHIGFQEFTEDLAHRSQVLAGHLNAFRVRNMLHDKVKVLSICSKKAVTEDLTEDDEETKERSYGSLMMETLTGSENGRIDHMLQDKTFEHQYISAIGSHTNYWRDEDTALFILNHLYSDIPKEPSKSEQSSRSSSKMETKPKDLHCQNDEISELVVPLISPEG
ncbi:phospholipase SGR2-like isoform X1 [Papaver somniferum]|uniref:phospholipase SGR2-like isoform X1 n=1 Tax=Papaver somniferum TaxID=3469 RepID=UPI000E6FD935|nr:phospholipase SGR2-like isoform X1 [Papaver somniferum]